VDDGSCKTTGRFCPAIEEKAEVGPVRRPGQNAAGYLPKRGLMPYFPALYASRTKTGIMNRSLAWRQTSEGVVLPIHVVPGAARERVAGLHDGRLKVTVSAPPEKGKANKAVLALLAATLGLKKRQVSIVRGETDRDKDLLVVEERAEEILGKLAPYLS